MKAKARPELKLVRDVKDNKSICRYISSKRKTKEIVMLLLNGAEHLVATGHGKDYVSAVATGQMGS